MDLSLGSARPMLAAIKRCGSLVEFSLITVNATCPGLMCFKPSLREINLQLGGKIEETRTMLQVHYAVSIQLGVKTKDKVEVNRLSAPDSTRAAIGEIACKKRARSQRL